MIFDCNIYSVHVGDLLWLRFAPPPRQQVVWATKRRRLRRTADADIGDYHCHYGVAGAAFVAGTVSAEAGCIAAGLEEFITGIGAAWPVTVLVAYSC